MADMTVPRGQPAGDDQLTVAVTSEEGGLSAPEEFTAATVK
jgi:hypothetical protein